MVSYLNVFIKDFTRAKRVWIRYSSGLQQALRIAVVPPFVNVNWIYIVQVGNISHKKGEQQHKY